MICEPRPFHLAFLVSLRTPTYCSRAAAKARHSQSLTTMPFWRKEVYDRLLPSISSASFQNREFKMTPRRRQQERQKRNRVTWLSNNPVRASNFLVHFFAVTTRNNFTFLGRKPTKEFSFLFKLGRGSWEFNPRGFRLSLHLIK